MLYRKVYSQLVDELEKIIYRMMEAENENVPRYYYDLLDAIGKCEDTFYKESTCVEEMRNFPQKYNVIYSKIHQKYKEDLQKRGIFYI